MQKLGFQKRLESFAALGNKINSWRRQELSGELESVFLQASLENPWFEKPYLDLALHALTWFLKEDNLDRWAEKLPVEYMQAGPKNTVALVLSGNLPAVGFADIFYVLMGGHKALIKFSSRDRALLQFMLNQLVLLEPAWEGYFREATTPLQGFDAIIVTGSTDTARHFDYYFRKYPRIIRGHRQSAAVLTGSESPEELEGLALDMTAYFGLGCRSVSILLTSAEYELAALEQALWPYTEQLLNHHRFRNNYDYRKAILLLTRQNFRELGPFLLVPSTSTAVPISIIHHITFEKPDEVFSFCTGAQNDLQALVSAAPWLPHAVAPGRAQFPAPWEYADNVDVPRFLATIS